MNIIKELSISDRAVLLAKIQNHSHKGEMENALTREHCYRVHIMPDDFSRILLNSSTEDRHLDLSEYPTLEQVIEDISAHKQFLETTRKDGRLSGTKVKYYFDEFSENIPLLDLVFLINRNEFPTMNPKGVYYIRDGVHRLVAFGLASQMREEYFPIYGYYSINKRVDGSLIQE